MAMSELNERGRATFAGLVPDGEARLDRIFQATPALGELAVGTVYGHLHARRTLDPRTREAVALAAIVAAGCTETPLTVHTRTGLAAGLTPAEIGEILTETAAFAGFPRAVTAAGRMPVASRVRVRPATVSDLPVCSWATASRGQKCDPAIPTAATTMPR